jgi:hypothetical protein
MTEYSDEEYYGEMKLMFQSKGWEMLVQELGNNAQVINNIQATKDERDLDFRKGQLAVLSFLINLEDSIRRAEAEDESGQ